MNSRGFSLPELIMAAGISFLVVLLSGLLITNMFAQDRAIKGALTADTQLDQADYLIQRYFRSAVDVKKVGGIANSATLAGASEGEVLGAFDSDPGPSGLGATYDGKYTVLALFFRDTASVAPPTGVSVLKPTGVYFLQPSPTAYGKLFIDDGSGGGNLGPTAANLVVDHITSLKLTNSTQTMMAVGGSTPLYVRSFQLTIDVRMPLYTMKSGTINWCGPNRTSADATCQAGNMLYKDVERTLTVILYNNFDPNAVPADGPSLGRVYFTR